MDAEKFKNKFKDLELVPNKNNKNEDALKASIKPQKSLKDVQKKYSIDGEADSGGNTVAQDKKDKNWQIGRFMPKNKNADSPLDGKLKMFDEEGNETASQG